MKQSFKNTWQYYLLLMPALLLSGSVVLVPAISTIFASFTDWNGISSDMNYIGLQNYRELFADKVFRQSLGNNFKWMAIFLVVPVLIALVAAIFLLKRRKSRSLYQVLFLLPYVVAPIANALLWLNMIYNPVTGIFGFLKKMGVGIMSPISNVSSALMGVAVVDIWHYWGFLAVVYLAALRQTPGDQIEAAVVEGCNGWNLFRHVYFPSMAPTFKLMMIMIVIQSFLTFDYVYLLTKGGPAHATEMLSTLSYNYAFSMFQFGKAAAVALIMSFFGLIASFFYARMGRKESQA